jgi:phosphoglycolate phosphatase
MKRTIDLVVFDLDGTLADTGRDLANAVNYIRARFDLPPLDNELVYEHVGRGAEHLIRSSLPESWSGRLNEVMGSFLGYYHDHILDTTRLYPDVEETLAYFGDKKRVVLTNKRRYLAMALLEGLKISDRFDAVFGGDSTPRPKPDPGSIREILKSFRIAPDRTVIVGDGEADIEAGKRAGVLTCGATYGLTKKEEIVAAKPDFLVSRLFEMTEYFA